MELCAAPVILLDYQGGASPWLYRIAIGQMATREVAVGVIYKLKQAGRASGHRITMRSDVCTKWRAP
jgi:DNA helicase TIP49 (TBP-interacting protein)